MMKKIMLIMAVIITVGIVAVPALYSQTEIPADDDIFAAEAPISQNDIDAFLAVWPQMMSPSNTTPPPLLFKQYGVNDLRGAYLVTKIGNAYAMNAQPELAEDMMAQMPATLVPDAEEVELVGRNMEALHKIYNPTRGFY